MAIPAALVILPVGILFIISGLIVNITQAIFFVLVCPLSKNWYRRINKILAESLWLELIWLIDWWAGIKVELHTDLETYNQFMGKENALVICNHRSDIDWLVGWVLAQRMGCLGSTIAMMKKDIKYLPVIGWSMWFSDYVFLERSWDKDKETLNSSLKGLKDFPMSFWLALFVEGTRFTETKLLSAQEFAASKGLPIPRHVLIPRTKGFVSAVTNTRTFIPAIYDCTFVVPKSQPSPTLLRMFRGISSSRYGLFELVFEEWDAEKFMNKSESEFSYVIAFYHLDDSNKYEVQNSESQFSYEDIEILPSLEKESWEYTIHYDELDTLMMEATTENDGNLLQLLNVATIILVEKNHTILGHACLALEMSILHLQDGFIVYSFHDYELHTIKDPFDYIEVKVKIKRHKMEELPETDDGIAQWCKDTFVAKDALLEQYRTTELLGEQEIHDIGRPKASLFVVISWSCLLVLAFLEFLDWSSLLYSWKGLSFLAIFLVLVTLVMEILILSSAAERSKPLKLPTQDPTKERLLPLT